MNKTNRNRKFRPKFGLGRILVETLGFGRFRSYTITETPLVKVDDLAPSQV